MTETEICEVLSMFACDFNLEVTEERIKLWTRQFSHVSREHGYRAADLLLSRKTYGFPRCHEFHAALREVFYGDTGIAWEDAWERWVILANRHGFYKRDLALKVFRKESPLGAQALGSMANEYFRISVESIPTLRAQFRERYNRLAERQTLNPRLGIVKELDSGKSIEGKKQKAIEV